MPMLRVRCTQCAKLIPTGLNVDYEGLIDLTHTVRTTKCPNCASVQKWNLDDVDRSEFPQPAK